jgi:wyosine [tRNA(Phe)-imidazoG37] synthetase (radical SAM superfamily)
MGEVEARIGKAKEFYVKMFIENEELKIEHNVPTWANALALVIDGLPTLYKQMQDEIKGEDKLITEAKMVVLSGASDG